MITKCKAKVVMDNAGKELMEEDVLEEGLIEEDSPPHRDLQAEEEEERFPHYVWPRRAEAEPMTLPAKAHTYLVASQTLKCVPLSMDIMPKLSKLGFKDYDTHL